MDNGQKGSKIVIQKKIPDNKISHKFINREKAQVIGRDIAENKMTEKVNERKIADNQQPIEMLLPLLIVPLTIRSQTTRLHHDKIRKADSLTQLSLSIACN